MTTEKGKLYQDRLYGTKVLSPLATAIIDSAEFQRLAGLHQLGFTDLVFRPAVHTRFEHSVGTYFISKTIMRRVVQNHGRLLLEHPGRYISEDFAFYPHDWLPKEQEEELKKKSIPSSHQARWRGLTEVVAAAALIHDLGHVPFGHTLEDEFTGIYKRHDNLAGARLYEMLFNEASEIANVFSDDHRDPWLPGLSNGDLQRLIYLILSWKDTVDPPKSFKTLLKEAREDRPDGARRHRLDELEQLYEDFTDRQMFHPFMSDIVGNTICADLMDYLPRDRQNLGMEYRFHSRLMRYFTIRQGTHSREDGLRLSILVTRKGRGGQRRDVATTVLDIMRERYQMAERVYYHHKKAAASTMLAKLADLASRVNQRPRDDSDIYPAPWNEGEGAGPQVPHVTHLSDLELIDYLGDVPLPAQQRPLQRRLYQGLRYRRTALYRTLLVIDTDLAHFSSREVGFFADLFRGNDGRDRQKLEEQLAKQAGGEDGDVLIYCPSPNMQAKEVDVRMEIHEGRVLPLRVQRESFAYRDDLNVLEQYYQELWRAYVFVAPEIYSDPMKCRVIVDRLCSELSMDTALAYSKVRGHDFQTTPKEAAAKVLARVEQFLKKLPFQDAPQTVVARFMSQVRHNEKIIAHLTSGGSVDQDLSMQFDLVALQHLLEAPGDLKISRKQKAAMEERCRALQAGSRQASLLVNRGEQDSAEYTQFAQYQKGLVEADVPASALDVQ